MGGRFLGCSTDSGALLRRILYWRPPILANPTGLICVWSERAAALMFDIKVQNGSIGSTVKARITGDFGALPQGISEEEAEVLKMRIIAERRAEAAKGPWIEDVRARKLCCANGRGTVHGIDYDLDRQFGIRLERFTAIDGRRI